MTRIIFYLLAISAAFFAGYKFAEKKLKKELALTMELDLIAKKQEEKMKKRAYVLVYKDKQHIYFASADKVDEFMKKNNKKIERIWQCSL